MEGEAIAALCRRSPDRCCWSRSIGVAITTVVLVRGIRESDRAQRWTSAIKALALLVLIVACLSWRASPDAGVAGVAPLASPTGLALLAAMAAALQGVIFAYDGWTGIVYYSGEVVDPGREIPRAIAGGLLSTIVLYLLINAAFLAVLPLAGIAAAPLAAAGAASVVFGSNGGAVVQLIIALALPSALVANTLNASRVIFAMSEDRLAPAWCARVNRGGTPDAALVGDGDHRRALPAHRHVRAADRHLHVPVRGELCAVVHCRCSCCDAASPTCRGRIGRGDIRGRTAAVLLGSLAFLGATLVADPRGAAIVAGVLVAELSGVPPHHAPPRASAPSSPRPRRGPRRRC